MKGGGEISSEKRHRRVAQAPGGTRGRVPHFPRLEPKWLRLSLSLSTRLGAWGRSDPSPRTRTRTCLDSLSFSLAFACSVACWVARSLACFGLVLSSEPPLPLCLSVSISIALQVHRYICIYHMYVRMCMCKEKEYTEIHMHMCTPSL